jgi:diguanylate cyclase (GGDEF)-like protein
MQGALISYSRKMLTCLAVCMSLLVAFSPATASNTKLTACVSAVQSNDSLTQILREPSRFDCTSAQSDLPPGDYWIKMDVPASAQPKGQGLVFRTASLWDEGFEIWAIHGDGYVAHYTPFLKQPINPMRLGATVVVPLNSYSVPVTSLIAKVKGSAAVRGVMLQSNVSTSESAITFEMTLAVLYAGFAGLCVALLVYNISLWRGMRERFLLAYCAMLIMTLTYGVVTSGAPHYFIKDLSGAGRLSFTIPLLAFTASSALIFMRYFFESVHIPKWLVRITYAQATIMAVYSVFYGAIAPAHVKLLDAIYVDIFIPMPLLFAIYIWMAWRHKDPFLGYFLLAWTGPVISAMFRMLHGFDILPYHILIENSTLLGLAFEALVSSLAIGYRVRLLALARDRAEIAETNAMIMADTDPLTGLLNRRSFLRTLLERQSLWTLVLLDIDHFKRVNDTLGHAGGDEAIILIADALKRNVPAGALIARLGGEEFAIAYRSDVPLIDPDEILSNIRQINLPHGYRITASIGIANRMVGDEHCWKILYRAADMALYQAKSGGRDRFVHMTQQSVAA